MTVIQTDLPPGPTGAQNARLNAGFFKRDPLGFLGQLWRSFGDVASFDLGSGPVILINDAALVRDLFRFHEAHLCKPGFLRASNRGYWGDGLTTLNDPTIWRARRHQLLPLFRAAMRQPRLHIAAELARAMAEDWADRTVIDLRHEMRVLTTRIALRTVLDADLDGFSDGRGRSRLVPFSEGYGENFTTPAEATPGGALQMTRPRAPKVMESVQAIIDTRFRNFSDRGDVLSALVQAHLTDPMSLTREEIVGEVIQMLFAGHLTVPFALTAFWRDVDRHNLDRLVAEDAATLSAFAEPDVQTLGESQTLAFLRESMRLSPPAPILYREVAQGFQLFGYMFSKGLGIWVSPGLLHRDSRYFSRPETFLPDRFAAGRLPPESSKAYMPFGAGPRVCIAAAQSQLQMATIIATLSHRWMLTRVPETSETFELSRRA